MTNKAELDAELAALNAEWDAITAKRKAWMDAHMADYAKYPIGTELHSRDGGPFGSLIGKVIGYYRYWGGRDPRYDRSMDVDYLTENGRNSSSQISGVESTQERAERLRQEAAYLSRKSL